VRIPNKDGEGNLFFSILVGAVVAALLANLLLSFIGVLIGAAVGVKVDDSRTTGRALLIGIVAGLFAGIVGAVIAGGFLTTVFSQNTQFLASEGRNVTAAIPLAIELGQGFLIAIYLVSGVIGGVAAKAFWVKKAGGRDSPKDDQLELKPADAPGAAKY
jgi:amino acid transporter